MENSKQAAYPLTWKQNSVAGTEVNVVSGITKLEYFSGLAMQGILAGRDGKMLGSIYGATKEQGEDVYFGVSKMAIENAKELLSQLEKEK